MDWDTGSLIALITASSAIASIITTAIVTLVQAKLNANDVDADRQEASATASADRFEERREKLIANLREEIDRCNEKVGKFEPYHEIVAKLRIVVRLILTELTKQDPGNTALSSSLVVLGDETYNEMSGDKSNGDAPDESASDKQRDAAAEKAKE